MRLMDFWLVVLVYQDKRQDQTLTVIQQENRGYKSAHTSAPGLQLFQQRRKHIRREMLQDTVPVILPL